MISRATEIIEEAKGAARVEGERLVTGAKAEIEQELSRAKETLRAQVAMLDAAISFFWPDGMMADTVLPAEGWAEPPPGPTMAATYRLTNCLDGHLVYWVVQPRDIWNLARALGHPEWEQDERWAEDDVRRRPENWAALGAVVMRIPTMTDFDSDPLEQIETGDWVRIDADEGTVSVWKGGRPE